MSDWQSGGSWPSYPNEGSGAPGDGPSGPSDPQWSWGSPTPAQPAVGPSGWPSPPPPPAPAPRSRRTIRSLLSTAGVLTVVAVILPVVASSSTAGAAEVVSAAKTTAAQQTAHLDLSGSISVEGHSLTIGGSGSVDFAQHDESLNANYSAEGQSESIGIILTGGTMYESVPGISTIEPGKSWISSDIAAMEKSAGSTSPLSGVDPTADIALLEQDGASVSSLGSSTVDGVDVTGYRVDISKSVIQSETQNLPSWAKQAASSVDFSGVTLDVYIDGANEFRRITVMLQIAEAGQTVNAAMNEDFSQYGDPVSISAPPADQVVPLQQFLADSGTSSGS